MSQDIKQFLTGIGIEPVSADPSNPVQGQLQYADGTVRAEGLWRYDGTAWQQVGSGAGSYDIFFQENLETNTSSNFTTGQNSTPDAAGTGSLGGALADEESSQISGDRSLKYTMNATAASSDNDFFLNDTDIALAVKQRGQSIGVTFYYTYNGDDDDIRFFVLDQDDNELTQSDEYIKASSTAKRFSTSVFVPSSDTALRYGFQVVTGNSSKVFIVDDIEFSTDPFVYKDLAIIEHARFDTHAGYGSTNTLTPYFTNERQNEVSQTGTIINNSTNGWRFTASRDVYVKIQYTARSDSNGNDYIGISRGPFTVSSDSTDVASLAPHERLALSGLNVSVDRPQSVSAFTKLAAGEWVDLRHTGAWTPTTTGHSTVQITVYAEAEHVVTPAKSVIEYIRYDGHAGFGSTNNKIPYFTNERENTIDQLVTVSNSSTLGLSFTAKKKVKVNITYSYATTGGNDQVGFTLNSSQLTTNLGETTLSDRLTYNNVAGGSEFVTISWSGELEVGDVLRPHTSAATVANAGAHSLSFIAQASEAQFLAAVPMNYTQTRYLPSNVTSTTSDISALRFENLVVGKMYEVFIQALWTSNDGNETSHLRAEHDGNVLCQVLRRYPYANFQDTRTGAGSSAIFTATATTVTFRFTKGGTSQGSARNLEGDGTGQATFARLTELNYTKETTRFTS